MSPTILVGVCAGPRYARIQQDPYAEVGVVNPIPENDQSEANHRSPTNLWLWSLRLHPCRSTKEQAVTKV